MCVEPHYFLDWFVIVYNSQPAGRGIKVYSGAISDPRHFAKRIGPKPTTPHPIFRDGRHGLILGRYSGPRREYLL